MHTLYSFHFLNTISEQLKNKLDDLPVTVLRHTSLQALKKYQKSKHSQKGVYLIHYDGQPVYLGKADDVAGRLEEHLRKLSGRKNIVPVKIGYKAIVLDESMSTAANEEILISMFKESHQGMWNGMGFGPKDPGQERDTTKPSKFDKQYPIIENLKITFENRQCKLGVALQRAKEQLPFVFRYAVPSANQDEPLILPETAIGADLLLKIVVNKLGQGWKGVVLSYGMILYKTTKQYSYGREVLPHSIVD